MVHQNVGLVPDSYTRGALITQKHYKPSGVMIILFLTKCYHIKCKIFLLQPPKSKWQHVSSKPINNLLHGIDFVNVWCGMPQISLLSYPTTRRNKVYPILCTPCGSALDYQPLVPLHTRFNCWLGQILEACFIFYLTAYSSEILRQKTDFFSINYQ